MMSLLLQIFRLLFLNPYLKEWCFQAFLLHKKEAIYLTTFLTGMSNKFQDIFKISIAEGYLLIWNYLRSEFQTLLVLWDTAKLKRSHGKKDHTPISKKSSIQKKNSKYSFETNLLKTIYSIYSIQNP